MRNPRSKEPFTLLDVIKRGYFQQVRFLVDQGVNLDQVDDERRTALMLCAFVEPEVWGIGIARLLIEHDADLDRRDKYGLSAFHYACIYERTELVKVFLKAIDFDLTAGDKEGNTGLHYAVRADNALLVRLIAQCYVKYKLPFHKVNKCGFSPLEDAYRLGKKRCVKLLECPEMFTDTSNLEFNLPLDLKEDFDETLSLRSSSRKTPTRPRSSILSRRSSKSSDISTDMYSFRRSPTVFSYDTRRYKRADYLEPDLPPNEKNVKKLIRCASMSDFRNNPEYLFHLTPNDVIKEVPVEEKTKGRVRAKSAFVRRSEVDTESESPVFSWRTEFRKLYVHFQYQCSPSYRDSVPNQMENFFPNLEKPMTPSPSEDGWDDDRIRKNRKISRQNTKDGLHVGKGKPPSKSRKLGAVSAHSKLGLDGALESSSESINSSVSSKKVADDKVGKGGKDKKDDSSGGRVSRTGTHKVIPSVSVEQTDTNPISGSDTSQQDSNRLRIIEE